MFDQLDNIGQLPSTDEIHSNLSDNNLEPALISSIEATTKRRIRSNGQQSTGNSVSVSILKKNKRIPCKYCKKYLIEGNHRARV